LAVPQLGLEVWGGEGHDMLGDGNEGWESGRELRKSVVDSQHEPKKILKNIDETS